MKDDQRAGNDEVSGPKTRKEVCSEERGAKYPNDSVSEEKRDVDGGFPKDNVADRRRAGMPMRRSPTTTMTVRMPHSLVFGYGSIINPKSRASTLGESDAPGVIAKVGKDFGWVRAWNFRSLTGFTALGLKKCSEKNCSINGLLFPVHDERAFDIREIGYRRVRLNLHYLSEIYANEASPLWVHKLKSKVRKAKEQMRGEECGENGDCGDAHETTESWHVSVWIYVPEQPKYASADFPICQSYVDTVISGCLEEGGEQFARDFIMSTENWASYYLNDIPLSRRPWLHRGKLYKIVDRLLQQYEHITHVSSRCHPEAFAARFLRGMEGLWGVPNRNQMFASRESELGQVAVLLSNGGNHSRVYVVGLAGIGKTQLAIEYAHRWYRGHDRGGKVSFSDESRRERQVTVKRKKKTHSGGAGGSGSNNGPSSSSSGDSRSDVTNGAGAMSSGRRKRRPEGKEGYSLIVWVRADSREALMNDLCCAALDLGLDVKGKSNEQVTSVFKAALCQCPSAWLLIFDNVESPDIVSEFAPRGGRRGHLLVTSRMLPFGQAASALVLDCFSPLDALNFLEAAAGPHADVDADGDSGKTLVRLLGGLPLALAMAAAYMRRSDISCKKYIQKFKASHSRKSLLEHKISRIPEYKSSVKTSLYLSVHKLANEQPEAERILYLLAYLAPDGITKEIIHSLLECDHAPLVSIKASPCTSLSQLQQPHALSLRPSNYFNGQSSHGPLQSLPVPSLPPPSLSIAIIIFVATLCVGGGNITFSALTAALAYIFLGPRLLGGDVDTLVTDSNAMESRGQVAEGAVFRRDSGGQSRLGEREEREEGGGRKSRKGRLGGYSANSNDSFSNSGFHSELRGARAAAVEELADEVWDALKTYSLLIVRETRRAASMHRLLQEVLQADHSLPIRLGAMSCCVSALESLWKFNLDDPETWQDAAVLLDHVKVAAGHVSQLRDRASKECLASAARVLTNAAVFMTMAFARFEEAHQFLCLALELAERATAPDEQVSLTLRSLGQVLRYRGLYAQAEEPLLRALEMQQRLSAQDLRRSDTNAAAAAAASRSASATRRRSCGRGLLNPWTRDRDERALTLHELGVLSMKMHRLDQAATYLKQALTLQRSRGIRMGGSASRDIAATLHQIGVLALISKPPRYDEAEARLEEALQLEAKLHNYASNVRTAATLTQLGKISLRRGKLADSEKRLVRALDMLAQIYTSGVHINVASVRHQLGLLCQRQRRYDDAARHLQQALRIRQKVYSSPFHIEVSITHRELSRLERSRGDAPAAEAHLREQLNILRHIQSKKSHSTAAAPSTNRVLREIFACLHEIRGICREQKKMSEVRKLSEEINSLRQRISAPCIGQSKSSNINSMADKKINNKNLNEIPEALHLALQLRQKVRALAKGKEESVMKRKRDLEELRAQLLGVRASLRNPKAEGQTTSKTTSIVAQALDLIEEVIRDAAAGERGGAIDSSTLFKACDALREEAHNLGLRIEDRAPERKRR